MTSPQPSISSSSVPHPRRPESALVAALLAIYLIVNLATASRSPTVWQDEVQMTDVVVNWIRHQGFISTAFAAGTRDSYRPTGSPLYSGLLFLWLNAWGLSVLAVRSMHIIFGAAGGLVLWLALRRGRWVQSAGLRLLAIGMFLCGLGISFSV